MEDKNRKDIRFEDDLKGIDFKMWEKRICPICGRVFYARIKYNKITCSNECYNEYVKLHKEEINKKRSESLKKTNSKKTIEEKRIELAKARKTCIERYGVDMYTKTKEFKEMISKKFREKDWSGRSKLINEKLLPKYKTIYTGNPCSEEALKKEAIDKRVLGLDPNKKLVLFVMGSLGSEKASNILYKTMNSFKDKPYEILFVTGKLYYDDMKNRDYPKNVKVVPYIDDMTRVMKKTDLMVSRAGASTLSEIMALTVPSILVPSPYVTNNHQYKNALDLTKNNAAVLIEEKDLNSEVLMSTIDNILNDEEKIKQMKEALKNMSVNDSALKIYEAIKEKCGL